MAHISQNVFVWSTNEVCGIHTRTHGHTHKNARSDDSNRRECNAFNFAYQDDIYGNDGRKKPTVLAALDISEDIDTHKIRLKYTSGIARGPLLWIDSHLEGSAGSVCVGKSSSSVEQCKFGVPQGSVLGHPSLSFT